MFSPKILSAYEFRRVQQCMLPIDACAETAEWHAVDVSMLAQFLMAIGVRGGVRGLNLI